MDKVLVEAFQLCHEIRGIGMRILTVVGARPQLIKAAVVSRGLRTRDCLEEIVIHTGQHYDRQMSDVFFEELDIPPPDLNLRVGSGCHGVQTGRMLERIEAVIQEEKPALVMVYGDTNSTIAGALAGAKTPPLVAHVEAGLRSFNRRMPEEINRILTDHISDLLFAPTETAVRNLERESLTSRNVLNVGDVMYDAFLYYKDKAAEKSDILDRLELPPEAFVLATVHRAENTDEPSRLQSIMQGLMGVCEELPVVFPLHPRTAAALQQMGLWSRMEKSIRFIEPVGYLDMIRLESTARVIATDSGGVQKEAYFAGVPCLTLRDETEWVELVEIRANTLCPPVDAEAICQNILDPLPFPSEDERRLFGDGRAGLRIVDTLCVV